MLLRGMLGVRRQLIWKSLKPKVRQDDIDVKGAAEMCLGCEIGIFNISKGPSA